MSKKSNSNDGYLLVQVLVFGAIAVIVITGLIAFAGANSRLGRRTILSEQAFQMAEAGLEYYRWHLAHAPTDYTDGTSGPGPYTKDFYDKDGVFVGTFTLTITPPSPGSTVVTIESKGVPTADTSIERKILSKLAIPSFANYAAVANASMRFGEGTEVFGPVHVNNGVRFDGIAHNLVTSALEIYNDPDHDGGDEYGTHTHANAPPSSGINIAFRPLEAPPNLLEDRSDVFLAGRTIDISEISFDDIGDEIEEMKAEAESNGWYFGATSTPGYKIVLRPEDSFDIYTVNTLQEVPETCPNSGQSGWGSWSPNSTVFVGNYSFPPNGLIFINDDVWVEGTLDTARLTIVAANVPDNDTNNRKSITVNNDLRYAAHDGSSALALIAQRNINIGMDSENDLSIDAALIAQTGRVGRYFYYSGCSPYHERESITLYGTIGTALRYGFAYTDSTGYISGYEDRNLAYDSFMLYSPPPFLPTTEDFHKAIFWKEIK